MVERSRTGMVALVFYALFALALFKMGISLWWLAIFVAINGQAARHVDYAVRTLESSRNAR